MAVHVGQGFLARRYDRRKTRPAGLVYWLADVPALPATLGLALQQVAVQSINFVIPVVLAGSLSSDPADASRFLSLSILAAALWQVMQVLTRGPVGSGYPIPGSHAAAFAGAYAVAGAAGIGFGGAGAMVMLTGLACVLLTFLIRRLRVVLPNEVAGVVVFLLGATLVVLATHRLGLQPGERLPGWSTVLATFASVVIMIAVALVRTRAAPFAVLIGVACGAPLSIALGEGFPDAAELLAEAPWLALPKPWLPQFAEVEPVALLAFLVTVVALKASSMGSLVVIQRGTDADWSRPDAPPIRRGLLANGLGILTAGAAGAACPAPATAVVGLSVATGTLARRIVWVGAALLVLAALCPKLVMLFVLLPEPVKAAMLLFTGGVIMAQGCQLLTARLLDMRRTLVVALGLSSGIAVAVAAQAFLSTWPVFASPLAVGAVTAFLVNLCTLPLVSRRAILSLRPASGSQGPLQDWIDALAGGWALKPHTAAAMRHTLGELVDLFAIRRVEAVTLDARLAADRVEVALRWAGAPLPMPPAMAGIDDLLGPPESREAFSVWLATREVHAFRQRAAGSEKEVRIEFED